MFIDIAIISSMSMEFSDWITKKYIIWRGDAKGHDRSITEFAGWIGVSQSLMSHWMKKGGKVPRSQQAISKLVDKFGYEVYDILGLPRESEKTTDINQLPPRLRNRLVNAMNEINVLYTERGTDPDSPEALQIASEVLTKHGFIVNDTE